MNPQKSSAKPKAKAPKKKPETTKEKLKAINDGDMTWAEAIGLTRTEAYGIAFQAHRLFHHGQVDRAKWVLERLVVANPKEAYFHALLAGIYGRTDDEKKALASYTTAITLDPNNLTARVNRADMLLRKGQLDAALKDLLAATRIDPQGATPLGKRAFVLARATMEAIHAALRAPARSVPQRTAARR